jgi:adenylate kinase
LASDHSSNSAAPAIILFGPPGSGKGTQAKLLRSYLNSPHISTGDMLRTHIRAGDNIGLESESLIRSGKLVPDDLVNRLVEERLSEPGSAAGIILDGYPRTINQAGVLLELLDRTKHRPGVVHLLVDYEKIVARLSGRRQCPVCGTLYSLKTNPPKVAGVCDLDGTALVTREDDREEVIRERLHEYESRTRPILDFFRKAGVPMFEIKAEGAPEEIGATICRSLGADKFADGASIRQ